MANVSIRDLRNKGGEIVDRAARGEQITITKNGEPVAELRPLPRRWVPMDVLHEKWKNLPKMSYQELRADLDEIFDPSL
ncbi:MAG TPA: type II toxin-antitoxin system prevent-host-death family antitoxin [Solirubrobacteraceae bacterium]|nr:type II toxin-antitoxin system prevent-host-death family antitoxin [Solirubrobacteraceae bacterium]